MVLVPVPLEYVACRTAPPIVSGIDGVPPVVTTVTGSLKTSVMSRFLLVAFS